jgi:hypothetical protein
VTGDAPQPGETPGQANPWTPADPDGAWWRGQADQEPAEGSRLATAGELMIIEPGGNGDASRVPEEEPEDRNRPTVALTPHRPPATSPAVAARLERMESSTFWLSEEERARRAAEQAARRPDRRRKPPVRNPASALVALLTLGLMAAFFGWVSAEPFWLAVGHGDQGFATTTQCQGSGLTQRCTGRFTTSDGQFSVSRVTLLGIAGDDRNAGAVSPARMVSPDSTQAYTTPAGYLMHLRWTLGFLLVLVCGYGIAEATGARRLESRRARRRAVLACLAGPLLLLGGFPIAAF